MANEDIKAQVSKSHYTGTVYDNKPRFCSYWHQIDETVKKKPVNVLEVGIGSGLVHNRLQYYGIDAKSLDVAADLKPDILGSVTEIPVPDKSFDVIVCCQVLEHLPYDKFTTALKEMRRVAKVACVVSLPNASPVQRFQCPALGNRVVMQTIKTTPPVHRFDGEHYWEIGKAETPLERVMEDIKSVFTIEREYRVFENPYHHFFILV